MSGRRGLRRARGRSAEARPAAASHLLVQAEEVLEACRQVANKTQQNQKFGTSVLRWYVGGGWWWCVFGGALQGTWDMGADAQRERVGVGQGVVEWVLKNRRKKSDITVRCALCLTARTG